MKNLKLLALILLSTLLITSCKDDEESASPGIVGVWNVTDLEVSFTVNNESLANYFGQDLADVIEASLATIFEDQFEDVTIEFKSDGTYSSKAPGETTETGSWALIGDKLSLDDDTITFDVIINTNSALSLQYVESDSSEDFDSDGTDDTLETVLELSLTK
jgi:hypothetical protein